MIVAATQRPLDRVAEWVHVFFVFNRTTFGHRIVAKVPLLAPLTHVAMHVEYA